MLEYMKRMSNDKSRPHQRERRYTGCTEVAMWTYDRNLHSPRSDRHGTICGLDSKLRTHQCDRAASIARVDAPFARLFSRWAHTDHVIMEMIFAVRQLRAADAASSLCA